MLGIGFKYFAEYAVLDITFRAFKQHEKKCTQKNMYHFLATQKTHSRSTKILVQIKNRIQNMFPQKVIMFA
ncbi:hypothetical protein ES703_77769 [subsurface metagenome]